MRAAWLVGLLIWGLGTWGAPYFPASAPYAVDGHLPPEFPEVLPHNSVRWVRWSDDPGTRNWTGFHGSKSGLTGRLLSGLGMRLGWGWEGDMFPLMSRSISGQPWVVDVTDAGVWTMGLKDPSSLILSRFFTSRGDGHWHAEDWIIRAAKGREMVFGWVEDDRIFWMERAVVSEGGTGHAHIRCAPRQALNEIEEMGIWNGTLPNDPSAYWDLQNYVVWADAGEALVWLSKEDLTWAKASAKTWREELLLMGRESGWLWNQGNTLFRGNDSAAISLELGGLATELTFAPLEKTGWDFARGDMHHWMYGGWVLFLCSMLIWGLREWQLRARPGLARAGEQEESRESSGWFSGDEVRLQRHWETKAAGQELSSIAHWSPVLRLILLQEKRFFTTAELDALLGIDDIASPETLRARRSRIIQTVNGEFNLLYGMDLILREREKEDRRKSLYRIAFLPPALQKYLQRHGLRGGPQGGQQGEIGEEAKYSRVLNEWEGTKGQ